MTVIDMNRYHGSVQAYDQDQCRCVECWQAKKWRDRRLARRRGEITAESDIDRFHRYVVVDDITECALWVGARHTGGYGVMVHNGRMVRAHRFSYEHFVGEIPEGMVIDHLCRVRPCVNPHHLRVVTRAENTFAPGSLSISKFHREKTHCLNGHELTPDNTYRPPSGARLCRICKRRRDRDRRARLRAER